MFGIYVDDDLVLVCPKKPYRYCPQKPEWFKLRDAIWAKFPPYDKPNCNYVYEKDEFMHAGKRIHVKELPT